MSDKESINPSLLEQLVHAIEIMHTHILDLEALASSAAAQLAHLPYIPRQRRTEPTARREGALSPARLHLGRLHSLVHATAENAKRVLEESISLVAQADALFISSGGNGGESNEGGGPDDHGHGGNGIDQDGDGSEDLRSPLVEPMGEGDVSIASLSLAIHS